MKRSGYLFGLIASFENLLKAARKAQRGKRRKDSTAGFNLNLENELLQLQAELQSRAYRIGALPYRDRVVQHALCNVIEPIFDGSIIFDSYACRKGNGLVNFGCQRNCISRV